MLADFAELYRNIPKVSRLRPQTSQEYLLFKGKRGLPVGLASSKDHLDLLPHVEEAYRFFNEAKVFWVIPCDLPNGDVIGFVLRGFYDRAYHIASDRENPQMVFGWGAFKDYTQGKPIVVTEGAKDCLYLQQYYPYVLAVLSAGMSLGIIEMLKALTKKVLIAFDNDTNGNKGSFRVRDKLREAGFNAGFLKPPKEFKDWGDCIEAPQQAFQTRLLLSSMVGE